MDSHGNPSSFPIKRNSRCAAVSPTAWRPTPLLQGADSPQGCGHGASNCQPRCPSGQEVKNQSARTHYLLYVDHHRQECRPQQHGAHSKAHAIHKKEHHTDLCTAAIRRASRPSTEPVAIGSANTILGSQREVVMVKSKLTRPPRASEHNPQSNKDVTRLFNQLVNTKLSINKCKSIQSEKQRLKSIGCFTTVCSTWSFFTSLLIFKAQ